MSSDDRERGKEHNREQISMQDMTIRLARMEEQLHALREGIDVAHRAMEKRLEGMNEFRAQLSNQATTFLSKETYDAKHSELQTQVDDLRLTRATLEGKASQSSMMVTLAIAVISILISAIPLVNSFINRQDINSLINERRMEVQ